jgi:D-3-phosphoglycerate dehydrogenase
MTQRFTVIVASDRYAGQDNDFTVERRLLEDFPDIEVELFADPARDEAKLIELGQRADALILSTRDAVTRTLCERIPRVKVIARYGVGLDNADLDAAADNGIVVTHYPQYCTNEVADHALAMILTLNRRIAELNQDLHAGAWSQKGRSTTNILRGPLHGMHASTVGIVGLGRIGKAVAARIRPFGARILVHDPYIDASEIHGAGGEPVSLEELVSESDYITLHCPLTPETRGILGPDQFARMKPTVAIVNTCRGPVINESALIDFLQATPGARAALDVTEVEPLNGESPLWALPNVILTPHSAYYSIESAKIVRDHTFLSAIAVLRGYQPRTVANPAVLDKVELKPWVESAPAGHA